MASWIQVDPVPEAMHAYHADSADYASNAGSVGGYAPSALVKALRFDAYSSSLAPGASFTYNSTGWGPNEYLIWKVQPLNDHGNLSLEVSTEYNAATQTETYHVTIHNISGYGTNYTLSYMDMYQ
jgi:hypothetical protein